MDAAADPEQPQRQLFRALRHPNYRLFFSGQLVSLVGTFLSQVTTALVIYTLTKDASSLGLVLFCGQIPLLFVPPFSGVAIDRLNRQRLLILTQALSAVQSGALAWLAFTGGLSVMAVAFLALFKGMVNAFDMPARQAFLSEMVTDKRDMPNAVALNSTMVHLARLIGPAAGGLLLDAVGAGWCFLIDAASYLAVIVSLWAMNVQQRERAAKSRGVLHELNEGFQYAWNSTPMRALLLLMATISLTGMPALTTLVPVYADHFASMPNVPYGKGSVLGFLMAASGLGALSGAVYLARRQSVVGLGNVICIASAVLGGGLIAFSYAPTLLAGLLIIPFCGWAMLMNFASANTLLQTLSEEDKRGRVMSLFTLAAMGMAPVGSLLAGHAAQYWADVHAPGPGEGNLAGAATTLRLCGAICLLAALVFLIRLPALRRAIRPVYERHGLLKPQVTPVQATASEAVAASAD